MSNKAITALNSLDDWIGLTGHAGSRQAKDLIKVIRETLETPKQDSLVSTVQSETVVVTDVNQSEPTYFRRGKRNA